MKLSCGSIIFSLWALPLTGQTVTGALVGHVADPTDAGMPDVKVVATEVNRGVSREAVTNEAGDYTISTGDFGQITSSFGERQVRLGARVEF